MNLYSLTLFWNLLHSVVKQYSRLLNFHKVEGLVNHRVKKEWSKSTQNLLVYYPTLIFAPFLEKGRKLLSTQVPCFHLCRLEISPLGPLSLGSRVQDIFKLFMENATGVYTADKRCYQVHSWFRQFFDKSVCWISRCVLFDSSVFCNYHVN